MTQRSHHSADAELFAGWNHTELYQTCRRLGLNVMPSTARETMIAYLLGEIEPTDEPHAVDGWRMALMSFLADHWQIVRAQLDCPAKNLKKEPLDPGEKRACFNCIDAQVISCVVMNPENEELIQLKRKKK